MNPRYRRARPRKRSPRQCTPKPLVREPASRKASFRLALTIALRTSARSLGRSALIVAMVALPVTGLVGIAIVADSHYSPTNQETIDTQLGNTEAKLTAIMAPNSGLKQNPVQPNWFESRGDTGAGDRMSPREALPAGTRILPLTSSSVTVTTAAGLGSVSVLEGQSWDPAFSGLYDVTQGTTPKSDREVMVTSSLLKRLGKRVGDSVELHNTALSSTNIVGVVIVGVMSDSTQPDSLEEFFVRSGAISGVDPFDNPQNSSFYLPDTSVDWSTVQILNTEGITALSRSVLLNPPASDGSFPEYNALSTVMSILSLVLIVAGFAAFEVILLAGAAFTVTARQQQRTLATIASVGAPQRLLFRILTANGIVLGALGGLVGVVFGIGGAAAFMVLTADGSSTQYYGFHVPWLVLVLAVAFAVLIGWVASLLPDRATSRFDIVAALRGSRKPPEASVRRPVVGLVLLLVGVALTLVGGVLLAVLTEAGKQMPTGHPLIWAPVVMLIAGPILAQVGLILSGPLLLRLVARLMRHSGLGARLAARDSARNPGRAVPALAAIMTTVFVAVFGMCIAAGSNASMRASYSYSAPVGTITVSLALVDWQTDPGAPTVTYYERTDAVEQAIRSSVSADQVRVLSAVPDPIFTGTDIVVPDQENGTTATIPLPTIPPQNLCPFDPRSPEYSVHLSESQRWNLDERCQNYYLQSIDLGTSHLFVGNSADLAMVLGHQPSAEAALTLAAGGAVSLYPDYVENDSATISWWEPEQLVKIAMNESAGAPAKTESLNAVVDLPEHPIRFGLSSPLRRRRSSDWTTATSWSSPPRPPCRPLSSRMRSARPP